mmetsp:Transcript_19612/g.25284  ORF Transcript_19612/g.25284 Transcript_19612/m.25284 type:complete len:102 (+) Transcript_19612:155-460(+)
MNLFVARTLNLLVAIIFVSCQASEDHQRHAAVDCSAVLCASVACEPEEVTFTPYGQCCPMCRPAKKASAIDCGAVRCAAPQGCPQNEWIIPEGRCCQSCPN